ncbi:MAG TPA: type I secretion system permease/ATPase [Ramlibacter sp.]|jgi:ATP-binding cassette subfamily C protein LapB|nr:type I secretion system permease/ATPase [Ramlibacter sp.]
MGTSDTNIGFVGNGAHAPGLDLPEDLLHVDPLLDCLVQLARIHGRPATRTALAAGLPVASGGMTPALFTRAASRVGIATRILRRPLEGFDTALLPLVILLQDDQACLLVGWADDGATACVLLPESGEGEVRMPRAELAARYAGYAISAQPQFRFDARAPEVAHLRQKHWFWAAVGEQLPLYRDVLLAALLVNVFALALPLFSMNVYDRVVPNFAVETLWTLAIGVGILLVADYVLRVMRGYFVDLASTRIDAKLSTLIMERVLGMRLAERPPSVGAYAATLRSFESVRDFIASATVTAVVDLPFAVLFLAVVTWISWPLVFAPILGVALVLAYGWVVQGRMQQLSETSFRAASLRNATLVEALAGMETIKAHGAERVMQGRLEDTTLFLSRVNAQMRLLSSTVSNGVMSLQQLVNVAMIVAGVYLIHEGMLTMGGLIACTMLAGRAMGPLAQVVGLLMQYHTAKSSLLALESTMNAHPERQDAQAFQSRPQLSGDIEFQNVRFAYPGREESSLRGLNLRIRAGEKVAILGRVGSGKTTLQRLVLGLYAPAEGSVRVDGIDLRQLDPADLRRGIGYVAQDPLLFYGTLRDNVAVAAPFVDDAAVIAALQVGGLASFVNNHPQGLAMIVGERGESLSGGQRQGIAIARAALLAPRILLLDEPTAAMDAQSEMQFKERLRAFAQDKTMVLVTHRSTLLDLATRVVVLDEGRVVADGPREQVMNDLRAGRVGRAA